MSLTRWAEQVWAAGRAGGWDPAETDFWIVPPATLFGLAVVGVPGHPPHWTYGRDYAVFRAQQQRGASRLYEMVIPGDPCQAYLSAWNSPADHEAVILHVAGHADLFAHHRAYDTLRRDWPTVWAAGAARLQAEAARRGLDQVERVWTAALSLANHVGLETPGPPASEASAPEPSPWRSLWPGAAPTPVRTPPPRADVPTDDVLGFVATHSLVLEDWARDACLLLREHMRWQDPLRRTKWVQEAYATWTAHELAASLGWAGAHRLQAAFSDAAVQWRQPAVLNWYDVGYRLLAWWAERDGAASVRAHCRDATDAALLGRWLTPESVAALDLWTWDWTTTPTGERIGVRAARDWRAVRAAWVNAVVSRPPRVAVVDVERVTLVLRWDDAASPDEAWSRRTLDAVATLWGGPVRLERPGGPPWTSAAS